MRSKMFFLLVSICCCFLELAAQTQVITTEVLVVGATTGGVAAGLQSARSGAQTIMVEQTNMPGGMLTAAGVSCTDGNDLLYSGIWQEFRENLYKYYGTRNLASGWVSNTCFEPSAANNIFRSMTLKEKKLQVLYGWYFDKVMKSGNKVTGVSFINKMQQRLNVFAQIVIDATDLGDVFAAAGAAYDLGMESPKYSDEKEAREKNDIIQDLTWAAVLKDYGPATNKTITRPDNYDAKRYYCSTSEAPCNEKPYQLNTQKVLEYGRLTVKDSTHAKYMINWPVHGNDYYLNVVEMAPIKREEVYKAAKDQVLGFVYFLQTELGSKQIGFANDELNAGMAWMPYNREGRRLKGMVRLNINHIKNPYDYDLYRTGIAVGDYPVDHHHGQYPGKVPGIQFPPIPSFIIPLGALIPEKIDGLIVCEKGISVSNIANGTTRLQPVVLLTGQAAGVLAAQCIKKEIQPRNASVREVQDSLLKRKAYIMPFVDITPDDAAWEAAQRVGAMGIIKGVGKSADWENKTFFYPDSVMSVGELEQNIESFFGKTIKTKSPNDAVLTIEEAAFIVANNPEYLLDATGSARTGSENADFFDAKTWKEKLRLDNFELKRNITRKELAVMLNYYSGGFKQFDVDFKGNLK